jgi:CheY-like chemotaxis protein
MEAVGRLAGGIAHDFNNVLSVILSYSDLILTELEAPNPLASDVGEIRKAALRAAELTRQLLVFSRQQVIAPKVLDLNEVVFAVDRMTARILGEDIELVFSPGAGLGRVQADRNNVEQVIMNLVVNARDAMPTGGKLTIETGNVHLDTEYALEHPGATPGPHVVLAVRDTGVGMDKATQKRIFEPFFTTKEVGKGTGLGLSTVFGIAQQAGGSVWVHSELGKGTTFKVYFPMVDADVDAARSSLIPGALRGTETILLVEDQEQVRAVAHAILVRSGYRVLVAQHPAEALLFCEVYAEPIHLLLTDVVMPHMSGAELGRRALLVRPALKVLYMSGYTDDSVVRHGILESEMAFLQKPFTLETLTQKVREVLNAATGVQKAGSGHSATAPHPARN